MEIWIPYEIPQKVCIVGDHSEFPILNDQGLSSLIYKNGDEVLVFEMTLDKSLIKAQHMETLHVGVLPSSCLANLVSVTFKAENVWKFHDTTRFTLL